MLNLNSMRLGDLYQKNVFVGASARQTGEGIAASKQPSLLRREGAS